MNIEKVDHGKCSMLDFQNCKTVDGSKDSEYVGYGLLLDIPIIFTEVDTVNQGILIVDADFPTPPKHRFEYFHLRDCEIRSYNQNNEAVIRSRPIPLLGQDNTNKNPLIFSFILGIRCKISPSEIIDKKIFRDEFDDSNIEVKIQIQFKSLNTINLILEVTPNLDSKVLKIENLDRDKLPKCVYINIIFIIIVTVLLLILTYNLNTSVYEYHSSFGKYIFIATGSVLTFIGLSLVQTKNWIKNLANLSGVFKYPELHFPKATTPMLKSRLTCYIFSFLILLCGFFTFNEMAVFLPELSEENLQYFDSEKKRLIDVKGIKMVRFNDLFGEDEKNPFRFKLVCNGNVNIDPIEIGEVVPNIGAKKLYSAKISYNNYIFNNVLKNTSNSFTYVDYKKNLGDEELQTIADVGKILCNEKINNFIVRKNTINFYISSEINNKDLDSLEKRIKPEISRHLKEVFEKTVHNYAVTRNLVTNLIVKSLPDKYFIRHDTLVDYTVEVIEKYVQSADSTDDNSKTHQNSILFKEYVDVSLLKALWIVFSEKSSTVNSSKNDSLGAVRIANEISRRLSQIDFFKTNQIYFANYFDLLFQIEKSSFQDGYFYEEDFLAFHRASSSFFGIVNEDKSPEQSTTADSKPGANKNAPFLRLLFSYIENDVLSTDKNSLKKERSFFVKKCLHETKIRLGQKYESEKEFINYLKQQFTSVNSSSPVTWTQAEDVIAKIIQY